MMLKHCFGDPPAIFWPLTFYPDRLQKIDTQIFERQSGYEILDQNVAEGCQKQCFSIIPMM